MSIDRLPYEHLRSLLIREAIISHPIESDILALVITEGESIRPVVIPYEYGIAQAIEKHVKPILHPRQAYALAVTNPESLVTTVLVQIGDRQEAVAFSVPEEASNIQDEPVSSDVVALLRGHDAPLAANDEA
jgi:hypothetical protein